MITITKSFSGRDNTHILATTIISGLLIAGCGGGGDSSGTSVSGKAIDGYIRGATLCLDKNYNFSCDEDEPTTTSQSGGVYTLGVSNADIDNYPIVVVAGSEAFDEGRGSYFSETLKLTAPSGVTTITPITTLVQGKISEGRSRSEAESEVATLLGISSDKLYSDYEASSDTALQSKAYNTATTLQNNGNSIYSTISALSGGGNSGGEGDTTAPTMSSTYPTNAAKGVGPYTWIDINFSEPMDSATLTPANITISGGKECQKVEYIGGNSNTARCYLYVTNTSHKLDDGTAYTITVTTNVKDSNGNAIANTGNTLSFTTGVENKLPRIRTGQTTSNADYDDGWYVVNGGLGIARSFTDNGDTVTDNVTNLMWQDDTTAASTTATWSGANTTCENLTLAGHSDWRLATIEELVSITNKGAYNTSKFTEFQNTANGNYWSSSTYANNAEDAWNVNFFSGNDNTSSKTNRSYVRCVRSG